MTVENININFSTHFSFVKFNGSESDLYAQTYVLAYLLNGIHICADTASVGS